jgi:hypothetical protein
MIGKIKALKTNVKRTTRSEKTNRDQDKSVILRRSTNEFAKLIDPRAGVESQAAGLNNSSLQTVQRQALAVEIGQLQGNEHLQRVIQNDPQTIIQRDSLTASVQAQWKADWNNPALADYQHYFKGEGRPKGDKETRYYKLCPLYLRRGIERPLVYMRDEIVKEVHFFQFTTPAHKDLETALKKAEEALKQKGYTELPAKSAWALNARSTSEGNWSNHAAGRAIDIDPDQNPRLTNKHNRDVISAMTGVDMKKSNLGYDTLKKASDTFKAGYNAEGLQKRLDELQTREGSLLDKQTELEAKLDALSAGKTKTGNAGTDLKRELKENKKETQTVQKAYELLEKELRKYEKEQKAYDKAGANLDAVEAEIAPLKSKIAEIKDKIKKTTGDQRKQLRDSLKSSQSQLKDLQKKRKKLDDQKHGYTLRDYAENGFVNLKKDVVEALQDAGLFWGGNWGDRNSKDIMHFQVSKSE